MSRKIIEGREFSKCACGNIKSTKCGAKITSEGYFGVAERTEP